MEKEKISRIKILYYMFIGVLVIVTVPIVIIFSDRGDLSSSAMSQGNIYVNACDSSYKLKYSNDKEVFNYITRYYINIDPITFNKSIRVMPEESIRELDLILKNFDSKLGISEVEGKFDKLISLSVDEYTYNKVLKVKNLKGVFCYKSTEVDRNETWKFENLLSNLSSSNNIANYSGGSLESILYSKIKENSPEKLLFYKEEDGEIVFQKKIEPEHNVDIKLTLDKNIEENIQQILKLPKYSKYGQIGVILMEAQSGNVRAIVQKDNRGSSGNVNLSLNGYGYTPGSIFKTIVEEMALDSKAYDTSASFQCVAGKNSLCKDKSHGVVDMAKAYAVSCNNAFAEIGKNIGVNNIMNAAKDQGVFKKVLGMEKEGVGTADDNIAAVNLAIGQSIQITPMQAIGMVNTVVNDGIYVKPNVIQAFVGKGKTENIEVQKHKAISASTARIMKSQMLNVVNTGTGTQAAIENIEIGGKTGTSQKIEKGQNYSDGWFIGFFKYNKQYYTACIYVKDINVQAESGGSTAAPIFKDVVNSTINCLKQAN